MTHFDKSKNDEPGSTQGPTMRFNALVPELTCADFDRSLAFYVDVLGFRVAYDRPEDGFAFLQLGEARLMLEQENDHWRTGPAEHPYGRGLNLQIGVKDADALRARVERSDHPLFRPLEEKWYRAGDRLIGVRQFLVQDPDGYLLRFAQAIGERPAS
jgi:catechol 2,3-dioxygenase-like lactoylglutathione lyase family enzyme